MNYNNLTYKDYLFSDNESILKTINIITEDRNIHCLPFLFGGIDCFNCPAENEESFESCEDFIKYWLNQKADILEKD